MRATPLAICVFATRLLAQDALTNPSAFHDAAASFIDTAAILRLPPGDTILTWTDGHPVLFHTARRDSVSIHSGLLRADRMVGVVDVQLSTIGRPVAFHVRWLDPRANPRDSVDVTGTVRNDSIVITGTRDTAFAVPSGRWAAADYGMEELLVPAFDGLADGDTATVAVLRPWGSKWDVLHVVAHVTSEFRVIAWDAPNSEQWRLVLDPTGHLLWLRRSRHPDAQKRPLPLSALAARFDRLRSHMELRTQFH